MVSESPKYAVQTERTPLSSAHGVDGSLSSLQAEKLKLATMPNMHRVLKLNFRYIRIVRFLKNRFPNRTSGWIIPMAMRGWMMLPCTHEKAHLFPKSLEMRWAFFKPTGWVSMV